MPNGAESDTQIGPKSKVSLWTMVVVCGFLIGATAAVLRYTFTVDQRFTSLENVMDKRLTAIEARLVGASERGWHREQMQWWVEQSERTLDRRLADPMDAPWWDGSNHVHRDGYGRVVKK